MPSTLRSALFGLGQYCFLVAGDDIRQKLEFHHTHLELGALGYIKKFKSLVFSKTKIGHGGGLF